MGDWSDYLRGLAKQQLKNQLELHFCRGLTSLSVTDLLENYTPDLLYGSAANNCVYNVFQNLEYHLEGQKLEKKQKKKKISNENDLVDTIVEDMLRLLKQCKPNMDADRLLFHLILFNLNLDNALYSVEMVVIEKADWELVLPETQDDVLTGASEKLEELEALGNWKDLIKEEENELDDIVTSISSLKESDKTTQSTIREKIASTIKLKAEKKALLDKRIRLLQKKDGEAGPGVMGGGEGGSGEGIENVIHMSTRESFISLCGKRVSFKSNRVKMIEMQGVRDDSDEGWEQTTNHAQPKEGQSSSIILPQSNLGDPNILRGEEDHLPPLPTLADFLPSSLPDFMRFKWSGTSKHETSTVRKFNPSSLNLPSTCPGTSKCETSPVRKFEHGSFFKHQPPNPAGFKNFQLKLELLCAIEDSEFELPSEVQHQCIPQAILARDVICQAKSGTGKTAVFVLSTLQQIEPVASQVAALVLCDTVELAYQVRAEFERFGKYLPTIKVSLFSGDVNIKIHKDLLKNECPHIVVGTPARVVALARDKDLSVENVRHFILDECDKMLESLDMRKDLQEIFKMTPHDKQVMMFYATLSKEIRLVCKKFMQDPMEIYVDESKLIQHNLLQHYIKLDEMQKRQTLDHLLHALGYNQIIIFVKKARKPRDLKLLVGCNFPSVCIHSSMSHKQRLTRYKEFKEAHKKILVATDVVCRGIDIERVNVVINYDMPNSADTYLHRIGRAGRFGTEGLVISFVSSASDDAVLNQVQRRFEVHIKELID